MPVDAGNIALFCDLGGTLVRLDANLEIPLDDQGRVVIELLPGVAEKLRPMRDRLIFVVTNQAGIKRGRLTMEKVEAGIAELDRRLGGILTAWQICPHDDDDRCGCRKPMGGMLRELGQTYGVDMKGSTAVGDLDKDEQAARAAGVGVFVYAKDFFGW